MSTAILDDGRFSEKERQSAARIQVKILQLVGFDSLGVMFLSFVKADLHLHLA
jgi:hypothetical protein